MEITDKTLEVLKNFATINSNIVINQGKVVKTVSEAKNVLSSAELDAEFPRSFGLYDLNEFLSTLSLLDSPRITFEETHALVSDGSGRTRIKYHYSDPEILTSPSKDIIMPEAQVTFTLDRSTLSKIKRAASVLGHSELSVSASDGVIVLSVIDINDKTSNAFSIDVDGTFDSENFNFVFNISNLKMVDGDYEVNISSKLISHFVNKDTNIEYWVALEKTSTYGA
jgi:hypothetical protein